MGVAERNGVAVGVNVGVALGIGEGSDRVADVPELPEGEALACAVGSEGVLMNNETIRSHVPGSSMAGRMAVLDA